MYDIAYHLNSDPFRLCPDHRFCLNHSSYAKNKIYLEYALKRGEGFVMITGAPGSGKTTLLNDVLENARRRGMVIARIVTTQLNADELLQMVAFAFKIKIDGLQKAGIIQKLEKFLIGQYHQRKRVLLVIDEAQDLDKQALEEMRLLSNIQFNDHPLLQIFLVGQDNLIDIIENPTMEQLHQRLIASSYLEPMNLEETGTYIIHRLRVAGWHHDPMFTRGAVKRIFFFSRGIPRIVNQFCSRFLLYGAVEKKHQLDSHDAQEVINELTQEHLAPTIRGSNILTHQSNSDYMEKNDESLESLDEQYLDYGEDHNERIVDEVLYRNIQHGRVTPFKTTNKQITGKQTRYFSEKNRLLTGIDVEPVVLPPFPGFIESETNNKPFNKHQDSTKGSHYVANGPSRRQQPGRASIPILGENTAKRKVPNNSYLKALVTIIFLIIIFVWIAPRGPVENIVNQAKSGLDQHGISLQHLISSLQNSKQ